MHKWTSYSLIWFVMTVILWACLTPGRAQWKHHSWRVSSPDLALLPAHPNTLTLFIFFHHCLFVKFLHLLIDFSFFPSFLNLYIHPCRSCAFLSFCFYSFSCSFLFDPFFLGSLHALSIQYYFLFYPWPWVFVLLSIIIWVVWSLSTCSLLYGLLSCYHHSKPKWNPFGYYSVLKESFSLFSLLPLFLILMFLHVRVACALLAGKMCCLDNIFFSPLFIPVSYPHCVMCPCAPFGEGTNISFPVFYLVFLFFLVVFCPLVTPRVTSWLSQNVHLSSCSLCCFLFSFSFSLSFLQKLHHFGVSAVHLHSHTVLCFNSVFMLSAPSPLFFSFHLSSYILLPCRP